MIKINLKYIIFEPLKVDNMTISPLFKTFAIILVFFQFISIGLLFLLEPIFNSGILFLVQIIAIVIGLTGVFTLKLGHFNIAPIPKKDCYLHTKGIYNFIRHPMYSSTFLFFMPALLTTSNNVSFLVFGVLSITLLIKLHFEEYLLQQKFPEYSKYQIKTKKLIPFIF